VFFQYLALLLHIQEYIFGNIPSYLGGYSWHYCFIFRMDGNIPSYLGGYS